MPRVPRLNPCPLGSGTTGSNSNELQGVQGFITVFLVPVLVVLVIYSSTIYSFIPSAHFTIPYNPRVSVGKNFENFNCVRWTTYCRCRDLYMRNTVVL